MYLTGNNQWSFDRREISRFAFHSILSILICVMTLKRPGAAFFVITPLILWMIFRPRPEYFFSMLLYMSFGSQHHYVVLLACFIYCIFHIQDLFKVRLGILFLFYICIIPVSFYIAWSRYGAMHNIYGGQFGGSLICISEFLFLIPFFWASVSIRQLPIQFFKWFWWFCIIVGIIHMTRVQYDFLQLGQYEFWILGYLGALLAYCLFSYRRVKIKLSILLLFTVCFIFCFFFRGATVTFTQFGLFTISAMIVFVVKKYPVLFKIINPALCMALMVVFVWSSESRVIKYADQFGGIGSQEYASVNMNSLDGIIERVQRKAIDDRATLWAANVRMIKQNFDKNPFYVNLDVEAQYELEALTNGQYSTIQTSLSAHNVFLQLVRNYSSFGVILFCFLMIIMAKRELMGRLVKLRDSEYLPFAAATLAWAYVGFSFGHAAITHAFSFILFGIWGVCYRRAVECR